MSGMPAAGNGRSAIAPALGGELVPYQLPCYHPILPIRGCYT